MYDLLAEALALTRSAKLAATEALTALHACVGAATGAETSLSLVREKLEAIQARHLELAHTLLRIEKRQKSSDGMRFEHPVYWRTTAAGVREGPYCPHCWEQAFRPSPVTNLPFRGHDRWVCRACNKTHFSEGARAAMEVAERQARGSRKGVQRNILDED